ncbi:alpha/beta fold hydrolase [Rhodobacterales bacterium HKCCE3408]|nr:alpha/beta fold hydrolase [Rhodobacterales bacterium HKCCE3408]
MVAIVLIALLGSGATRWQAARNEALAIAENPPAGDFLTVNGARVHYVMAGDGPDIVLIHGASGSVNDFTYSMLGRLDGRFRVTIFDRPGFGYSDRIAEGASIAQQADHLAAAAAALGIEQPIVLGQSYGGAVALAWALARPGEQAGLVLVSAASNPWSTGIGAYYTVLSSAAGRALLVPLLTAWVPDALVDATMREIFKPDPVPEGYIEHFGPRLSLRRSALRENALERRDLLDEIEAQVGRYPEIAVPAEILHGTADTIVSAQVHSVPLADQLQDANLTLLPGVGHMSHHAAEDEVVAAIDRLARRAGLR